MPRDCFESTAGHEESSGIKDLVEDWHLKGLEELLTTLPTLEPEERKNRARLLWESLGDLEERRGRGIFDGSYSWTHYGSYKTGFAAYFVRRLNAAAWVPDAQGELQSPGYVVFERPSGGSRTHFCLRRLHSSHLSSSS